MKDDTVSLISTRIISILDDHRRKSKRGYIQIHLENVGECEGAKMKLQLQIFYDGKVFSQTVSDCLSFDEIGEIHKVIQSYCNQNPLTYATK